MKTFTKLSMFIACFGLVISPVFSQTVVPNGDFENWSPATGTSAEPTNWNGNKTGGGFANLGPQTCFRESTNPHSGTYCLRLTNGSSFGTPVNATVTTGKIEAPSTNPAQGYIHTLTSDANFNSPFVGRPDSLVGWYRYTQVGADIGRVLAVLHDNFDVANPDQGGTSAPHIIGEALYDLPTGSTSTWTRFAVPFNYNNGNIPQYILLIATASNTAGVASIGTNMWVDDLSVVYCTNATNSITEVACGSYTSPSGNNTWMTSGTYLDTLVGAHGNCDSIYTINLTINNADVTVTDNTTSLMANAVGAAYQWVDCNNSNAPIFGETNAMFTPTVNGDYAVEVTENGCTQLSICYNFTMSGINHLAFANNLKVYPNPTNGHFVLDLGAHYAEANVVITDINGRTVHTAIYNQSQRLELDLNQPAGVYFVAVTSETGHAVVKLIKE